MSIGKFRDKLMAASLLRHFRDLLMENNGTTKTVILAFFIKHCYTSYS